MVKAVIFDMDGLMVDTEVISYEGYSCFLKDYGVENLTKEEYCLCFAGKSLQNGLIYARDYFHLNYSIEEGVQYFINKEKEIFARDGAALKPGLVELLDYLKEHNIKMAMATSSGLQRVHKILDPHNVLHYFDDIICGDMVKKGKPAPDIFLKACETLNVKEEDAIVLEDSETGILASYRAKVPVICIPDMKVPSDEHKEMTAAILPSLHDVITYIESKEG